MRKRKTPDKNTILTLRQQGLSWNRIGKMFGVRGSTVCNVFHYVSKTTKGGGNSTRLPPKHVIDHLRAKGYSPAQIAQLFTEGESDD